MEKWKRNQRRVKGKGRREKGKGSRKKRDVDGINKNKTENKTETKRKNKAQLKRTYWEVSIPLDPLNTLAGS